MSPLLWLPMARCNGNHLRKAIGVSSPYMWEEPANSAQPLMDRLGIQGTVRASFALYNTKEEVDALVAGISRVAKMF